jgi:hypothetical protein
MAGFLFALHIGRPGSTVAFFMGARIVLYVVVALLIATSVFLAVHSLRDQ